jgi:hypothetical protein
MRQYVFFQTICLLAFRRSWRALLSSCSPEALAREPAVKMRLIWQIKLDTNFLSCPSCQCVAAVELDREGKSPSHLTPSRPERGGVGHRH